MPPKKAAKKGKPKGKTSKPAAQNDKQVLGVVDYELMFGKPESLNDKELTSGLAYFEKLSAAQLKTLTVADKKLRLKAWFTGATPAPVRVGGEAKQKPAKAAAEEDADDMSSTEEMESEEDESAIFTIQRVTLKGPTNEAQVAVGRTQVVEPTEAAEAEEGWETSESLSTKKDKKKKQHEGQRKKQQLAMVFTVAQLEQLFATTRSHRQLRKHFIHILDGKLDQKFQLRTFAEGKQSGPINRNKQARSQFFDLFNAKLEEVTAAYPEDSTPLKREDALLILAYILSHCGEHIYENQNEYLVLSEQAEEGERKIRLNKPETDKLIGSKAECDATWGELIAKHSALSEYNCWRKLVTATDQGWNAAPLAAELAAAVQAATKITPAATKVEGEWLETLQADILAKKGKIEDLDAPWLRIAAETPSEPEELKLFELSKERIALFDSFVEKCAGGDTALATAYFNARYGPLFASVIRPPHNAGQYLKILRDVLKVRGDGETKTLAQKIETMSQFLAKEPRLLELPKHLAAKTGRLWGNPLRSHPDFGTLYPAVVAALK